MDDRKPVNLGVQEMEVSPNDSENSEDSVPENPLPLGSQALPSEMSAGPSSQPSVPAAVSSSQDLNVNRLGETSSAEHQGSSSNQGVEDSDSSSPKANLGGDSGVLEARDESHRSRSAHERTLGESNSIGSSSGSQPIGSDIEIVGRISSIQESLITFLEKINEMFEIEGSELTQFSDIFDSFSAKPITLKTTQELSIKLRLHLKEWREKWAELPWEPLKPAAEAFALFIRVVVQTLVSTVLVKWSRSRLNLYLIMLNYENFSLCGERFSRLKCYAIRNTAADDTGELNNLGILHLAIATYSLPMQNALSELLKCVEYVDAGIVYQFDEILFDSDKNFLNEHYPRRGILEVS